MFLFSTLFVQPYRSRLVPGRVSMRSTVRCFQPVVYEALPHRLPVTSEAFARHIYYRTVYKRSLSIESNEKSH